MGTIPCPAQWVRDLALLQLWLSSWPQLWSDPWPGNSKCRGMAKGEKKKKVPLGIRMPQPSTGVPTKKEYMSSWITHDFDKCYWGEGEKNRDKCPGSFSLLIENFSNSYVIYVLIPLKFLPTVVKEWSFWSTHAISDMAIFQGPNSNQQSVWHWFKLSSENGEV